MIIPEFIEKKNSIIYDAVGITLVSDRFITDMKITENIMSAMNDYVRFSKEKFEKGKVYLNKDLCPYCNVYLAAAGVLGCTGCPLYDGGNGCLEVRSTYSRVTTAIKTLPYVRRVQIQKDLTSLAKEFISSNKHIMEEEK